MSVRLKMLRKQSGMTLDTLGQLTGLTKSYLSKVERGLSTPSISVALKLAEALRVDVESLFAGRAAREPVTIVRKTERIALTSGAENGEPRVQMIGGGPDERALLPFVLRPPADFAASTFKEHAGDEFLFVHRGAIEVEVGGKTVGLKTGDAMHFNAALPHRIRSLGAMQAEVLVVVAGNGNGAHESDET
jgi:transcriptional regulator with XRE-family HTH domain